LKNLLFWLLLLILAIAPGCGIEKAEDQQVAQPPLTSPNKLTEQATITPEISDIIDKQAAAMKEIKSCRSSAHLEMDFKSSDASTGNILIIADMRADIDAANRLLNSSVTTNLSISGSNEKMTQQIIAAGDSIYFKDSEQGQWQKKILEGDDLAALWNEQGNQLPSSKYSALISPDGFVISGKAQSDGHTCYVLKQPMDFDKILKMAPELLSQLQNTGESLPVDFGKLLQNAQFVCLIDSESYYLREVQITADVNQDVQGKKITGTVQESCRYTAFNQPVSVKIPETK
jgi:hypothetical protein